MLCSRYSCWPRILIFSSFSLSSRKVLIFSIRLNLHGCALCFNRIRSIMHLAVKKEIRTHRIYTMYDYSPPIQTICLWYLFCVRIIFHATRQLSRNFLFFFSTLWMVSACVLCTSCISGTDGCENVFSHACNVCSVLTWVGHDVAKSVSKNEFAQIHM